MVWDRRTREQCAALMRLVASLLFLADLAEDAASRSPVPRAFVLWALRCAEAIAWDFVVDGTYLPHRAARPALVSAPGGISPEDALDLAATFRALAWLLETEIGFLLALGRRCPGRGQDKLSRNRLAFAAAYRDALSERAAATRSGSASSRAPDTS